MAGETLAYELTGQARRSTPGKGKRTRGRSFQASVPKTGEVLKMCRFLIPRHGHPDVNFFGGRRQRAYLDRRRACYLTTHWHRHAGALFENILRSRSI
jgi:hypothetical protein